MELDSTSHIVVSFSWPDRILLAVVAALLGAVFAYASSEFQSWRERKRETIGNVAGEFLHLLDVLDESIKNFWSASPRELKAGREIALSVSIKSTLTHAAECMKLLFKLKKLEGHAQQEIFHEMIESIGRDATMGAFEGKNRKRSADIITQSGSAILNLRIRFQEFLYK